VFGGLRRLVVQFHARIDPVDGLQSFAVSAPLLSTNIRGAAIGTSIRLTGKLAGSRIQLSLPRDEHRMFGEALSPLMAVPQLTEEHVGRSWAVDFVNPLAGDLQTATVTVWNVQTLELEGVPRELYRLGFALGDKTWGCWVTGDGEVLVQGTPFGLTLVRSDLSAEARARMPVATEETAPAQDGS
jgi:hypothetical protein